MKSIIQLKTITPPVLIILVIACFALSPGAQAVGPEAPDAALPNGNTAEGDGALSGLTGGFYNSAFGFLSLLSNADASFNTGVGAGTLLVNTANNNTATGAGALLSHTTGNGNTANGAFALFSDTSGQINTATGADALFSNTSGGFNTADGQAALFSNTIGGFNTATGAAALSANVDGNENTAIGEGALGNNTSGNRNVALGVFAGVQQTTGSDNIYIGFNLQGTAGESNTCYIGSIFGQTAAGGSPVFIDANSKLGTLTSSKRFKEDIRLIDKASEALFALKPVTFRYKREIDPAGLSQFGLVAEDVEKVDPELVVRDKEGKPYSVRYDQVNAMLLNEFLKEHRKVEELEATVAQQQKSFQAKFAKQEKQIEALTSGLQKISAQIEATKPERQVAANNP
jgi:hypothetical protein